MALHFWEYRQNYQSSSHSHTSGPGLSISPAYVSHLILTTFLGVGCHYWLHFIDEKIRLTDVVEVAPSHRSQEMKVEIHHSWCDSQFPDCSHWAHYLLLNPKVLELPFLALRTEIWRENWVWSFASHSSSEGQTLLPLCCLIPELCSHCVPCPSDHCPLPVHIVLFC